MDGPVVMAARAALQQGRPDPVLAYVPAAAEAEMRDAFQRALAARAAGGAAAAVAEQWLFETAVRLHRAGEGQPFTGLRPAGLGFGPVVPLAEQALAGGDPRPLFRFLTDAMHQELHRRFDRARHLAQAAQEHLGDVAAARERTSAELSFMVWAHGTYLAFAKDPHASHAGQASAAAAAHGH